VSPRCEEVLLTGGEDDVGVQLLEPPQQLCVDLLQLLLPPALVCSLGLRLVPGERLV